jgi:hypothetical protein
MAKVKVTFIDRGFRKLMRDRKTAAKLRAEAARLAAAAGPGFKAISSNPSLERARAVVYTDTREAMEAEATNRSLSRAAFARRIGR